MESRLLAPRLASRVPPPDLCPDGWLDAEQASSYLALSVHALHKPSAARVRPLHQDGPGCKFWFRRDELGARPVARLSHKPRPLYEFDNRRFSRRRESGPASQGDLSTTEMMRSKMSTLSRPHNNPRTPMVCATASAQTRSLREHDVARPGVGPSLPNSLPCHRAERSRNRQRPLTHS
jgi:hypothetical protein